LVDDRGARIHGCRRRGDPKLQRAGRDFDDIAVPLAQTGEAGRLVLVAFAQDEVGLPILNTRRLASQPAPCLERLRRGRAAAEKGRG